MSKGLEAFNRILGNDYFNVIISSRINGKRQYANDVVIVLKALKRLEELEKAFHTLSKDDEKAKKLLSKEIERVKILRDIKDKQDYALKTISDIIRDFNKGEFASAEIALQEITNILSEVLL